MEKRKFNILFSFLILLILIQNPIFSQTPPYYHYSTSDGLASSTVFDVIQDQSGYIWFATINGISRFDGNIFRNYSVKDGLNSNNITCLEEGNDSCIYIGNYDKGINLLKENKILKLNASDSDNPYINHLLFDGDKLLVYHYVYLNEFHDHSLEKIYGYFNNYPDEFKLNKILRMKNGYYLAATSKGLYYFQNNDFKKINIEGFTDCEVFSITEDDKEIIYAGVNGKITLIKDSKVIDEIPVSLYNENKVFRILKDRRGNVWFSLINRGFFLIPVGSSDIIDIGSKLNLQNSQINCFFEDNENDIWVCTFGDGIYCLNNLYLNNYNRNDGLSNNNVYSLEKDKKGRIIAGTFNGINLLDGNKFFTLRSSSKNKITDYVQQIKVYNDTVYVCGSFNFGKIEYLVNNNVSFQFLGSSSSFCRSGNEYYNGGWTNNIEKRTTLSSVGSKDYETLFLFGNDRKKNRVNDIFVDSKKNLWVATELGACRINSNGKAFFPNDTVLGSGLNSIVQDRSNKVWLAGDKGIASYNLETSSIASFPTISGYSLSSSTSLALDKYNRMWIGNMSGLCCWNGFELKIINTTSGLPSNEVYSLYYDSLSHNMWIGTSNGLTSLDIDYFDTHKDRDLEVKLNSVKAGDSIYYAFGDLNFETNDNDVKINLGALNYSSPKSLIYQYSLNEDTIFTSNDVIEFNSMKWGNYNFGVKAKKLNGNWSRLVFLSFTIKPSYYYTLWFNSCLFGFVILTITSIAYIKVRFNRKKDLEKFEINRAMNELQHQAIAAMMNPHFIFNSLNSVQHLINTEKKLEANNYISLMSRLIRMNLNSSRESYIRLSEEIKRLELYLSIEKLRFGDSITHNISLGAGIIPNYLLIPNMIIQPFIENAIRHGLMTSGKEGYVAINFNFENVLSEGISYKSLFIRIKDNGIGIEEARKLSRENHISKGIKIVEEHLALLSKDAGITDPLFVDNIKKLNSSSEGTEVIISLPPPLYKITHN